MLMLQQREKVKGKIDVFPEIKYERKKREKKKRNKCSFKERIKKIKEKSPDQSAINLSARDLTPSQKSVLAKCPTLVPNKC